MVQEREDIKNDPSLASVMEWVALGQRITPRGFHRVTARFYHDRPKTRLETRLEAGFKIWLENHPDIGRLIDEEEDREKCVKATRGLYLDSALDYLQWNGYLPQTLATQEEVLQH